MDDNKSKDNLVEDSKETLQEPKLIYTDIHVPSFEEIAKNEVPVVEKKEDEKPAEPVVEEKKPEITEEEIDLESIKKEIESSLDEKIQKIQDSAMSKQEKDTALEDLRAAWTKEGRNPRDYDEIYEAASTAGFEKAKKWFEEQKNEEVRKVQEQRDIAAKQQEETKRQEEDRNTAFLKYTNDQLQDLYDSGKLERPKDPKDPSDYGVKLQEALLQKMMEVNIARGKDGKAPIYSIKEIFYEHFTPPSKQPAGDKAPVSAGRGAAAPDDKDDRINYTRDIKGSWGSFMKKLSQEPKS